MLIYHSRNWLLELNRQNAGSWRSQLSKTFNSLFTNQTVRISLLSNVSNVYRFRICSCIMIGSYGIMRHSFGLRGPIMVNIN